MTPPLAGEQFDDPLWDKILEMNPQLEAAAGSGRNMRLRDEAFDELTGLLRGENPTEYDGQPLPPEASELPPGSALKLDLMERRVQSGLQVFHPGECVTEAYARLIEVARNGRPQRAGLQVEGYAEPEEDEEVEAEWQVALEEARYLLLMRGRKQQSNQERPQQQQRRAA